MNAQRNEGEPDSAPGRVLIVDDEPAITVALARKLRRESHDCLTAGSAEEALRRVADTSLDLVITDVRMPGMDGLELLKEIKRRDPELQVIVMTAYAEVDFAVQALRHHADDYLLKPFDLAELTHSVARCLEHRRLLRENRALRESMGEPAGRAETADLSSVLALARAVEMRDGYSGAHVERVMRHSLETARRLGLSDAEMVAVKLAAILHDVGKLAVPERILNKPGSLTQEEWQEVRAHPRVGLQIIEGIESLNAAAEGVLHHHERWDGNGYPDGLTADETPRAARVVAVADAFDAMMSERPYRAAMRREEAVAELHRESGTQFDPQVVDAFLAALEAGSISFPNPVRVERKTSATD